MSFLFDYEASIEDIIKKVPSLPNKVQKLLARLIPYIVIILVLANVYYLYSIWRWAHASTGSVFNITSSSASYGISVTANQRLSFSLWIAIFLIVIEIILMIFSILFLRYKKKFGWNLLYFALLINIIYGLVIMLTDYGNVFSFIEYLVIGLVGLYVLYQIKSLFSEPGRKLFILKR